MNFLTPTNHENPPDNKIIFEEYFSQKFLSEKPETNREYLEVCWTNYYVSKNYCNDDMSELQEFLDALDTSKKYFTICQWDDGIRHKVDHIDLFTFGSGGHGDVAYPLNCVPHEYEATRNRDVLASFMGAIKGRHQVREKMYESMSDKDGVYIGQSLGKDDFINLLSRSIFALCPRGYGKTSFRICEALQLGVIPVYIYDEPWIPFADRLEFESYGILCHVDDIDDLYDKLKSVSLEKINQLIQKGQEVYEQYYHYNGCYNTIIEYLT